jgi:DnaJ-domain-containing protein 1
VKERPNQPTAHFEEGATIDTVLADAAHDLFSRLLNRALPDRVGYVGDDAIERAPADPHRVLGLKPGASKDDIKRRVRQLAKVFHPDVPGGDADKMAEVNDAARALLDRSPVDG